MCKFKTKEPIRGRESALPLVIRSREVDKLRVEVKAVKNSMKGKIITRISVDLEPLLVEWRLKRTNVNR